MAKWLRVKDSLINLSAISRFRVSYDSSNSLYHIEACLGNGEYILIVTFDNEDRAKDFFNRLPRKLEGLEDVLIL